MANWHLTLVEVYSGSNWWFFSTKVILEEEFITLHLSFGQDLLLRGLAWLMFIHHLLLLQFFQRKEITCRQLQQLHAGTGLVWFSWMALGLPGSTPCSCGFLVTWSTIRQAIVLDTDYLQPQEALLHWLMSPSVSRLPLWPSGEEQVSGQFRL